MINAALGAAELGAAANGPDRALALEAFAGEISDLTFRGENSRLGEPCDYKRICNTISDSLQSLSMSGQTSGSATPVQIKKSAGLEQFGCAVANIHHILYFSVVVIVSAAT